VATVAGDRAAVDGALRALSKLTRVNIMSHPNVVARNEKEALIEILEEIPYIDSTVTTTGDAAQGVGTSAVENVEFKEVGIKLKVTPSILNDGCISLTLDQDVSEQVATFNNIPVVNHRHINTQFTVANNNTIIIGGLMKEYYFEEESGVPFLKDLPLLGFLFRGTTRVKEKVELVVLITPRIVSPKATIGVNSRCLVRLNGKD
jgi:type II secretory pathway component GspD/PulD (secretin)